jgi:hypothetical protein
LTTSLLKKEEGGTSMSNFPDHLTQRPGVTLTLDPTRLLLAFKKSSARDFATAKTRQLGLVLEETQKEVAGTGRQGPRPEIVNHTTSCYWVRSQTGRALASNAVDQVKETFKQDLDWIGPVYRVDNEEGRKAFVCPLPSVLIVKPKSNGSRQPAEKLVELLDRYGLKEVTEKSKYLGEFRYFVLTEPMEASAYDIQRQLLDKERELVAEAHFEYMPMIKPIAIEPNDPLYAQQWDMTRVFAGGAGTTGWDICPGPDFLPPPSPVVVCILDEGCDLEHPDLQFSTDGINLHTMLPDGSPTGPHGTACAGIAAASFNNSEGVAGVAGHCEIMPLAFEMWSDVEVAAGINYATANGAHVISMSFGWNPWNHAIIDPAIQNAHAAGVVMCVATHNYDGPITYPATNPLVMACGASDEVDDRKSPTSPDGELWGSDFGPEMSVVAPGVHLPTTDIQGAGGYIDGNYFMDFTGTSGATPHVAGLAALLRSLDPLLTNVQVRNIIEQTAEKVGAVPYAETPGYPNGTWNQEMGYGRINVLRALDFADVFISDYPGDIGVEPSTPPWGDFWDFSDIVIRPTDDDLFNPSNPTESNAVERGQTNYLYVRVTNNGPRVARNVAVNARMTPYVMLEFIYPDDWSLIDSTHISPTPITASFASIPAGGTAIAKFSISAAEVEELWGWTSSHPWHPCLLASVTSDNDYAFASVSLTGGGLVVRRNNFAQRNLSIIDVVAGATMALPFLVGNLANMERLVEVVIDLDRLPRDLRPKLALVDEETRVFPRLGGWEREAPFVRGPLEDLFVVLEHTRLETAFGGRRGVLTLEKGSRFSVPPPSLFDAVNIKGGELILRDGSRLAELRESKVVVRSEKRPGRLYPLELQVEIPASARRGQRYFVRIAQRNSRGEVVGGASVLYRVK